MTEYNNEFTFIYKSIISKNGLVDTGELIRSVMVFATLENDNLIMDIRAVDYIKYLVEPYRLTKQFIEDSRFDLEVERLIFDRAESVLQDILDGNGIPPSTQFPTSITITYNGE
jgi:hypothetical protein